jgi:hypothetical protein
VEPSASELIVELAGKYKVRDISVEEPEIEAIVREIYRITSCKFKGKQIFYFRIHSCIYF